MAHLGPSERLSFGSDSKNLKITNPAVAYCLLPVACCSGVILSPRMPTPSITLLLVSAAALTAMPAIQQGPPAGAPTAAPVEITYCGLKPGRPPLKYMAFKVTIRNSADKPQWFLLPTALYDKPVAGREDAGVDGIELSSDAQHQLTVVTFMGTMKLQAEGAGGFRGVLLPAGAVVSLQGFRISYWGEPVSPVSIRVVMADEITLGGVPVAQWMGKSLLSAKTADVKELVITASKPTQDLNELPVEIKKSGEFTIADALAKRCDKNSPR